MNRLKKVVSLIAAAAFLFIFAARLNAEEEKSSGWEFTVIPYAWLVGIDGDVTVKGQTAHLNVDFGDIIDNLDFAGQMQIEARKGRAGMFLQPNYLKVTTNGTFGPAGGLDVDVTTKSWIVEFGGFYRLGQWGNSERPAALELIAGGRYWYLKNELDASIPAVGIELHTSSTRNIIDPIIGLRFNAYLTRHLLFNVRGDVGGFGISGSSSDISWNAVGVLGYQVSRVTTIYAGYRALKIDFEQGDRGFDVKIKGPVVAIGFRF